MLVFGLCSTSDGWLSNLSNESHPKCEKVATKLSKNEMLIFGLRSTSDDQPSNLSDKSCAKCKKKNGENFYGKIYNSPPQKRKSWKGKIFLWQIWHDQNLMYLPTLEMKSWKSEKIFYGRFGMTPPPSEGCGWD